MSTQRNTLGTTIVKSHTISIFKFQVVIGFYILLSLVGIKPSCAQQLFAPHGIGSVHPGVTRSHVLARMAQAEHINLAVSLPLQNQVMLASALQQVYDPQSPYYRHYVSSIEFDRLFGPSEEQYNSLIGYFRSRGFTINATSADRMVLDIGGSIANVEQTFHVKMLVYQHPTENRTFFGPSAEPTLDRNLPILDVTGLDNYELPRSNAHVAAATRQSAGGTGPSGLYVGFDFRHAYCPLVTLDGTGQTVALFQFGNYFPADITAYDTQVGLPTANITQVTLNGVSATANPGDTTLEQSLDIEMVHCMAPGANIMFYTGANAIDIWNQIATDDIAKQVSSSWSVGPPPSSLDQTLQKMALQGQSVFNASGDNGFSTSPFGWDDDANFIDVGGTDLSTATAGGVLTAEDGWSGSGGYISPNFSIPTWQQGIDMTASGGSTTQRNCPDVSMVATNIWSIFNNGGSSGVLGTSAASPLWAGYLALVNQQATAHGFLTAGFINPAVYAIGKGPNYNANFNDITSGNNGMTAVTGYDLVTGWGSPKGQNLIDSLSGVDYSITAAPNTLTPNQGLSVNSTITVNATGGFSNSVSFSASGLPAGVTASSNPGTSTSGTTLTLSATRSAATGPATITIIGTSGPVTKSTTISLNVLGNYTITANPSSVAINQGTSGTSTITVVPTGGFAGSVAFSASGLPSGVTASFSPSSSLTSTVLTLTANNSATLGSSNITITGTNGTLVNTTLIRLTVNANYALTANPTSLTISQRTSGTSTITVVPNGGFAGNVVFAATGVPSGVAVIFSPASSTSASVLTLSANATAAIGTSTITITGTSGPFSEQTTVTLTVNGNFTLTPNPGSLSINQRTSGTSTITVVPTGGFAGTVAYSATGLPSGVTASFSPSSSLSSTVLTLSASGTAVTGPATVTVTGTSGVLTNSTTIALTVLGNYTLSAGPSVISLKQAKSTTSTITVNDTGGFTNSVAFSVSGLPNGVTASFSPSASSSSTILTLTASVTATIGPATLIVKGTSGSLSETAQIALTVTQGWTVTGFTVTPTSVVGGSSVGGAITLSDPTPAGGEPVSLSVPAASATYVSFPATVTVAAGQTSVTFSGIQTHTLTASRTIVISATLGASSQSASLNSSFIAGGTQAGGLEFFSLPWAYNDTLNNIFEFQIPRGEISAYNAANLTYIFEGGSIASPTPVTITPGIGYWAVFPSGGESLNYLGTPASSTVPTTVALSVGYNAIGDPYTSPISISSLTFGSSNTSFSQATGTTAKLISPTLYYFIQGLSGTAGSYSATGAGQALTPGKGYWIYAYSATTVTFPLPAN